MRRGSVSFWVSLSLSTVFAVSLAWHIRPASEPAERLPRPAACFAPDTPEETLRRYAARQMWGGSARPLLGRGIEKMQFGNSWSFTATDGDGLVQGDPATLTWSVVPDGVSLFGYYGESTSPSDLNALLDGIYGNRSAWLTIFQEVFDRWTELSGVRFVQEAYDDGRPWTPLSMPGGVLGTRGDIRIAGHPVDGNSGFLAYSFPPESGDILIDTSDGFYGDTRSDSLGLRNLLAHEVGHALGLRHVCPVDRTKLMEPFINYEIEGPQLDDVLGAQRGYGDLDENNDTSYTAKKLGTVNGPIFLPGRSIDDNSDKDFYRFSLSSVREIDVEVTPLGASYLSGPQNQGGSCSSGTLFDSTRVHDLRLHIVDRDQITRLATTDLKGPGHPEALSNVALSGPGPFYLEIEGDREDSVQLYDLEIKPSAVLFADGFESGMTTRWSEAEPP